MIRSISVLVVAAIFATHVVAQTDTTFTYQGRLNKSGAPVNGPCDFVFRLLTEESGGAQVGQTLIMSNLPVENGLFTADLDFGVAAFNGAPRWLRIDVRSPAGSGPDTTLSPPQPVMRTPYAMQTRGLYADASLNVGIGTTVPEAPLHVQDGSAGNVTAQADSSAVFERSTKNFVSILSPSSISRGVLFGDPSNIANGAIVFNDSQTPNGLQFRTGGNQTNLVIEADGRVGVGTFSPSSTAQMTVAATDAGRALIALSSNDVQPTIVAQNLGTGYALQVNGLGNVTPSGARGLLLVGSETGLNVVMDSNQIGARNNGQNSTLYLNSTGGDIRMGAQGVKPAYAYGYVSSTGTLVSSSPNIVLVQHVSTGTYYITAANGFASGDIFLATAVGSITSAAAGRNPDGNQPTKMYVITWKLTTDERDDSSFSFVVYRP